MTRARQGAEPVAQRAGWTNEGAKDSPHFRRSGRHLPRDPRPARSARAARCPTRHALWRGHRLWPVPKSTAGPIYSPAHRSPHTVRLLAMLSSVLKSDRTADLDEK